MTKPNTWMQTARTTATHINLRRRSLLTLPGLALAGLIVAPRLWAQPVAASAPAPATPTPTPAPAPAPASASASVQLEHFIAHVQAASGRFTQTTVSPDGAARAPQSGRFAFARPGRFRWETESPYEQLIVADGVSVFQYDPDLSQVTVRALDSVLGSSPAAILFGTASLADSFDLTEQTRAPAPDEPDLDWLRAVPHSRDAGFAYLDIGLRANLPVRLDLLDGFGHTTRITLGELVPAASLPAETFHFVPPADADVVRM